MCCAARTCSPPRRARSRCTRRWPRSASPTARAAVRPPALRHGRGQQEALQARPQSNLFLYREQGFLPEGLLNYLALLGWSIGDDRDVLHAGRDGRPRSTSSDVNPNPARFDLKKAEAINADCIRALAGRRVRRPCPADARAARACSRRRVVGRRLALAGRRRAAGAGAHGDPAGQAAGMLGFLFVDEAAFTRDPQDAAALRGPGSAATLAAARSAIAASRCGDRGLDRGGPARRRSSRASGSSRSWPSARCGWPSRAGGSRRRCSSRSSCSAASAPWPGSTRHWPDGPEWAATRDGGAPGPPAPLGWAP